MTMSPRHLPRDLYRLVKALQAHPADSPAGCTLANVLPDADGALRWLEQQERRMLEPLVFSFEMPGYVLIGEGEDFNAHRDPQLLGLYVAWEVFLYKDLSHHARLGGNKGLSPNGLRNALKRGADWVERHCPRLGVAIRAIEVDKEGFAAVKPEVYTAMRLHVF